MKRVSYGELVRAVQAGRRSIVRLALSRGRNPNYSPDGYSLLHWATQEGQCNIIRLLAQHGADIEATGDAGLTPLVNAAGEGDLEVVQVLVELGANVNGVPGQTGPLLNAVAYGNEEVAAFLIARGAEVNATDEEGKTPLFYAAMYGQIAIAELLLSHGANKNVTDKTGNRPVDEARASANETLAKKKAIVKLLT